MNTRKTVDWHALHLEFRANLLSLRQLADRYGITEGAIRKRARRDNWVRDLSDAIRDAADDMVRKADSLRTPRTEREAVLAGATSITEQKLKTRKQLAQTQQVFDSLIDELTSVTADPDSLNKLGDMMRAPDEFGADKAHDAFIKATSLPVRMAMLKTASDTLKNLQAVSRLEYGIDKTTATEDQPKLSPTQTVARLTYLLDKAGMRVGPKSG
jgi:hypothetical protein